MSSFNAKTDEFIKAVGKEYPGIHWTIDVDMKNYQYRLSGMCKYTQFKYSCNMLKEYVEAKDYKYMLYMVRDIVSHLADELYRSEVKATYGKTSFFDEYPMPVNWKTERIEDYKISQIKGREATFFAIDEFDDEAFISFDTTIVDKEPTIERVENAGIF